VVAMAVCLVIQTLLFLGAAIGAFLAWRRASEAVLEAKALAQTQAAELQAHLSRVTATVEETARALRRSTTSADDLVTDVRDVMGTVRDSVGSVASVVTAPRAALALGLWRGFQVWRKRRGMRDVDATATTSEI
jgi:hypothetical protein